LKLETENCKCPLCEGKVSRKARNHVLKELGKLALDPSYKPKTFEEKDTDE